MSGGSSIAGARSSGERQHGFIDYYQVTGMCDLSREAIYELYWLSIVEGWVSPELRRYFQQQMKYYEVRTEEEGGPDWLKDRNSFNYSLDGIFCRPASTARSASDTSDTINSSLAALAIVTDGNGNQSDEVMDEDEHYDPVSPTYDPNHGDDFGPESPLPAGGDCPASPEYYPTSPSYGPASPLSPTDRYSRSRSPEERRGSSAKRPKTPTTPINAGRDERWLHESPASPACSLYIDEDYQAPWTPSRVTTLTASSAIKVTVPPTPPASVIDDDCLIIEDESPAAKRARTASDAGPSPPGRIHSPLEQPNTPGTQIADATEDSEARKKRELEEYIKRERLKIRKENEEREQREAKYAMQLSETRRQKIAKHEQEKAKLHFSTIESGPPATATQHPVDPPQSMPLCPPPAFPGTPNAAATATPKHVYSNDSWLHLPPPQIPVLPSPSSTNTVAPPPISSYPPPQHNSWTGVPVTDGFPQIKHPANVSCAFCSKLHPSECCRTYDTFEKRLARQRELKLCIHCLHPHGARCKEFVHQKWCTVCNMHKSHPAMCNPHHQPMNTFRGRAGRPYVERR